MKKLLLICFASSIFLICSVQVQAITDSFPYDVREGNSNSPINWEEDKIQDEGDFEKLDDGDFETIEKFYPPVAEESSPNIIRVGDYDFDTTSGKLLGYIGPITDELIIPSTLNDIEVKIIGSNFDPKFKKIVIPEGVTEIQNEAFNSSNLEEISLPSTLLSIGDYAFFYTQLKGNLKIPSGVKSIGKYAFQSNFNLDSVTLPRSITKIGKNAFKYVGEYNSFDEGNYCMFYVEKNSYAEKYAKDNKLKYGYRKWTYRKNRGGKSIKLTWYAGYEKIVKIRRSILGKKVRSLSGTFDIGGKENPITRHILIPNTVKSIFAYTFNNYSFDYGLGKKIIHVYIPRSVKYMSKNAFAFHQYSSFRFDIHAYKGSYAHRWAKKNSKKFRNFHIYTKRARAKLNSQ